MTSQQPVEGGLAEPEELEPAQGELALAAPDDRYTRADWERSAAGVLRKARRLRDDDPDDAVWQALTRGTLDGIPITPLGTPELLDGLTTSGRPLTTGDWDIRTQPSDNAQAREDLENGATSLWVTARGDLTTLLDGVPLDRVPVVLDRATADQARELLHLIRNATPAPRTNLAAGEDDFAEVARMARDAGVLASVVDGSAVHDRGASDVQELGHALASAAARLRTLADAGFDVAEAASLMEFRLAATDSQFQTIAKLRAARRLWSRMLELSGVTNDVPMLIHAVTSRPMMSKYDPWVNMLRTTVAAFAAGVGGADAVTVVPFDSPLGEPDDFGRRIARNTSHLLLSESHLGRVSDPAGGAYAIEKLTDELALAAWEELGLIEAEGIDFFERRVAETVAVRGMLIAERKWRITGLTEFPHLAETLPERSGRGDDVRRWGAAFEELRDRPAAQPVFLATMGPVAAHTARATFAANLFAAGGVAVETAGATDGVDDVVAAYRAAASPVVCLCGTDASYDEWGRDLVDALRGAGARRVLVAGDADLGADDRCSAGTDALALLRRTREELT